MHFLENEIMKKNNLTSHSWTSWKWKDGEQIVCLVTNDDLGRKIINEWASRLHIEAGNKTIH